MPSHTVELLAAVHSVFGRLGVRWYLFGAQAVIAYGAPRLTADADVTVELGDVPPARLVEALESAGFRLRVQSVDEFVERTRVLPFVHAGSGLPVDVVLAGPGPEELFLGRVRRVRLGDIEVPVISPEDLVAVKVLAGRPKDLEDVLGILHARRGDIDLRQVRSTVRMLEKALERSDMIPELERLIRASRSTKQR
jgi:hypothetical protein